MDDPAALWVFETSDGLTFRAEVEISRKTFYRNHWVYNLDGGHLISIVALVSVALDLDARRAVEIPSETRAALESRFHPDLR